MRNKKGRMDLERLVLSFMIFSVVMVAGVFLLQDVDSNYDDVNLDTSDFNSTFNTIDNMYNITQDQKAQVLGNEIEEADALDSSIKGAYSAVRLVSNTFSLFGNIINDVASILPIPKYFVVLALTAMTAIVTFGIIYLFIRVSR